MDDLNNPRKFLSTTLKDKNSTHFSCHSISKAAHAILKTRKNDVGSNHHDTPIIARELI